MADLMLAAQDALAQNQGKAASVPPKGADLALAAKLASSQPPTAPAPQPTFLQHVGSDLESMGGAASTFGQTALSGLEEAGGGILRAAESIPGAIAAHPMLSQALGAGAQAITGLPAAGAAQLVGSPAVAQTAEGMKGITQAQIQEAQDRAADLGQQHPVAGFLGQFVGQNLPAALVGSGVNKIGSAMLPPAENAIVNFARKRLIDAATGAVVGATQPTGPGVGTQMQAGALFGAGLGAAGELASKWIPPVVSKAAAFTSKTARQLIAGSKLLSFLNGIGIPETGPMGRLSIGQLTGNPDVLDAEQAIHGTPAGYASALDRVSQNNAVLKSNLQNLTGSLLDAPSNPQGIQQAAQNIRNTLLDLEAKDSENETNLWNNLKENNPDIGFHAPSVAKSINTTLESQVEPEFLKQISPLTKEVSDMLNAARNRYGDVVPFSTLKNIRTILLNNIRDATDSNYKRVAGNMVGVIHNYMLNPNNLVTDGNLPISTEIIQKRNLLNDFNAARSATAQYYDNWGDNALNDFIGQRGANEDQEFTQGLNKVSTLLSPNRPDLTDYTLNALSRKPGGMQDARDWFVYQFKKNTETNALDSNGNPVVDPAKAYGWLSTNIDTAKKIFNSDEQREMLDNLQDFFKKAKSAAAPGLSRERRQALLDNLGVNSNLDMILNHQYTGRAIDALPGSRITKQIMASMQPEAYDRIISDALNDPEFAKQLMRKASSSPTLKFMQYMQRYAPQIGTSVGSGMIVRSLPPNQGTSP